MLYLHITESLLELSNFLLSLSYFPLPLVLGKRNNTLYTHQFEPGSEPAKLIYHHAILRTSHTGYRIKVVNRNLESYHMLIGALILFKLFLQLVILAIILGNLLSIILQQLSGWTEVAYRKE